MRPVSGAHTGAARRLHGRAAANNECMGAPLKLEALAETRTRHLRKKFMRTRCSTLSLFRFSANYGLSVLGSVRDIKMSAPPARPAYTGAVTIPAARQPRLETFRECTDLLCRRSLHASCPQGGHEPCTPLHPPHAGGPYREFNPHRTHLPGP